MNPTNIFYILIAIIIINFLVEYVLDSLNAKQYGAKLPQELEDVYPDDEYKKSMDYKKANHKFGLISSLFSLALTLAFFFIGGFEKVNAFASSFSDKPIIVGLIFFGVIMIGSDIITTPFGYYKNFVIEEKFGFNKMSVPTFFGDKIKESRV